MWIWVASGFTIGAWCLQQRTALPPLAGAWLVPVILFFVLRARHRDAFLRGSAALLCATAFGFYWAAGMASLRLSQILPVTFEGQDLRIVGVVSAMPERTQWGWRFQFDVEHVLTPGAITPQRILLQWLDKPSLESDALSSKTPIVPGERWRFTVRLKRPHGNYNPNGFDYEGVLLERGIGATGYVRPDEPKQRLAETVFRPMVLIERTRSMLRERMRDALAPKEYGGVLIALALGDQRAISSAQWQLFTRTGVNHLMSISGLHITMLSGLLGAIGQWFWRRSARMMQWMPAPLAAAYTGFGTALSYALLTGFAIPAQRTVLMLGVVTIAAGVRARVSGVAVLAIALLVVQIWDPWAVNSPGFWLSFLAVAVLMLAGRHTPRFRDKLYQFGREQWALMAALAPCLLIWFQQVSLVAPIANAFAVPMISFVVVPLALLLCAFPMPWLASSAHGVLTLVVEGLEVMANLPSSTWTQSAPDGIYVLSATLGAALLLLPRGLALRFSGMCLVLPMLFAETAAPRYGEAQVTVLDVGQGLAVVVRTQNEVLLFDAGPAWSDDVDSGARIVLPYLRSQGISRLTAMVVSHDDRDHSGGARSVLDALPTAWFASSWAPDTSVLPRDLARVRCQEGQQWRWSGVEFQILHPAPVFQGTPVKDNDRSCVLRLSTKHGAMLLTGDIEAVSERALWSRGTKLRAEILIAPHHGSQTSSTLLFVNAVAPQHVVFAVGYRNRFGHPHPSVLARYQMTGARIWRSDHHGAITVWLRDGTQRVSAWRDERPRYWHTER